MKTQYNTKQRRLMSEYILNNNNSRITAGDIASHLKMQGTPVGLSTVYRFLDKMIKEGNLIKFYEEGNNTAYYRSISKSCNVHCHFLCNTCGKIFHIDCSHFDEFSYHISSDHNFTIDLSKTIFSGQCKSCKGGVL